MNGRNMNRHQIQTFLALADEGSFSAAASSLFTSQPAVSYQIKSLERSLGVTLFKRTTTSVALTGDGKKLLPVAREIEAQYRKLFRMAERFAGKSDFILGLPKVMMVYTRAYYTEIMDRLSREYPSLSLSAAIIPHPDKTHAVLRGDVDIQMSGVFPPVPASLEMRPLFLSSAYLAMQREHPLAGDKKIDPNLLAAYPVYADSSDDTFLPAVLGELMERGCKADVKYLETLDFSVPYLLKDRGIALTSTAFSSSDEIVYRPLDIKHRQIALFWLREKETPHLRKVVDVIENIYNQIDHGLLLSE